MCLLHNGEVPDIPRVRRCGSGRHSTATPAYQGPNRRVYQAYLDPRANAQWSEAAGSPTVCYSTLASMMVDPSSSASVLVSLRPHGKVETVEKHQ